MVGACVLGGKHAEGTGCPCCLGSAPGGLCRCWSSHFPSAITIKSPPVKLADDTRIGGAVAGVAKLGPGSKTGCWGWSRVIAELGTTSHPRWPWARTVQGLLSTPGPLAAAWRRER